LCHNDSAKKLAEDFLDKLVSQSFFFFSFIGIHSNHIAFLCSKVYSKFDGDLGIPGEKSRWPQCVRRV